MPLDYNTRMAKRKGNYVPGPGRQSFEEETGEEWTAYRFKLPASMHSDLQSAADDAGISMAELLRNLINSCLAKFKAGEENSADEQT